MKFVIEEYGELILQIIGGLAVVALVIDLLHPNGALHELIVQLAESAC